MVGSTTGEGWSPASAPYPTTVHILVERVRMHRHGFIIVIVKHRYWGRIWPCSRNYGLSLQKYTDILKIRLAQTVGHEHC